MKSRTTGDFDHFLALHLLPVMAELRVSFTLTGLPFSHTFYMDQVLEECHDALNVSGISHDAAITPQKMTECCQRLLDYKHVINPLFHETKLIVSTFYTVMKDGEITIPWNWENEQ